MNAVEKLQAERAKVNGQKEKAIAGAVLDALIEFCEQNEEFARAIEQTDKTFPECLTEICKGVGSSISDIEAYRRAVEFYFPGAIVDMVMTIRMSDYDEPKVSSDEINLSLFDLLG